MKDELKEFLSKVKFKDFSNLTEYVYKKYINVLEEEKLIIDNLIIFLEWGFKSDKSYDISDKTSDKSYVDEVNKAAGILRPNIDNLIDCNVERREFYEKIWTTISNPAFFVNEEDKIGALIFLESYDKVPYFKLDKPLDVSEEEFNDLLNKLDMPIQKCIYIFNRGYDLRTEVSSQLLRIIEAEDDEKCKVVLLAGILHYLEWTLTDAQNDLEEEEED